MGEPQLIDVSSAERLTWAEICARYPGEWVHLVEADWIDEDFQEFRTAIVVGHGPNRNDPYDQTRHLRDRYEEWIFDFTGPIRPAQPLYLSRPRVPRTSF